MPIYKLFAADATARIFTLANAMELVKVSKGKVCSIIAHEMTTCDSEQFDILLSMCICDDNQSLFDSRILLSQVKLKR